MQGKRASRQRFLHRLGCSQDLAQTRTRCLRILRNVYFCIPDVCSNKNTNFGNLGLLSYPTRGASFERCCCLLCFTFFFTFVKKMHIFILQVMRFVLFCHCRWLFNIPRWKMHARIDSIRSCTVLIHLAVCPRCFLLQDPQLTETVLFLFHKSGSLCRIRTCLFLT